MTDTINGLLTDLAHSPWVYLIVFALATLDGFFPVLPSESVVISAGVFAASGQPHLAGIIAVAAVGAFTGDHLSYLIGRTGGSRLLLLLPAGTRRGATVEWVRRALARRGGLVLVVARYIPGGRTTATVTMGSVGYRTRSFTPFAALAACSWAVYWSLVGYLGGFAFERDPLKGVIFGIGLAVAVTVIVETVRHLNGRSGKERAESTRSLPPAKAQV